MTYNATTKIFLALHNYNTTVWQSRETKTDGTMYTTLRRAKKNILKLFPRDAEIYFN